MPIIHQLLSVKHRIILNTGHPPEQVYMTVFERDRMLRELRSMRMLWHYQITPVGETIAGMMIIIRDYQITKH